MALDAAIRSAVLSLLFKDPLLSLSLASLISELIILSYDEFIAGE